MEEAEIHIYHHPNTEIRSYLTATAISAFRVEHFKNPMTRDQERQLAALGSPGAELAREIMAIAGVQEVTMKPQEIRVKKEPTASWEGIERRVMDDLRAILRRKKFRLVKA